MLFATCRPHSPERPFPLRDALLLGKMSPHLSSSTDLSPHPAEGVACETIESKWRRSNLYLFRSTCSKHLATVLGPVSHATVGPHLPDPGR